ncbi:B3 domain-containing transcription factor FUS3 isoform X1 [Beta vulgaris subsp. vulgaris]|uniref:B3 domain-containing transcription factor FUS3 isoform X1 n=1 Tax=Beta vulgaris subsp. vulgaris TaxID=3555 RepID=UPI0020374D46|nr:B3 domain-containing transcription factor FUS3 isoform X1 [Beta vulgaris subsp. vulgaris]
MMMMVEERENEKNDVLGFAQNNGVVVFNSGNSASGNGGLGNSGESTRAILGCFGEHKIQRKKRMARQRRSSVSLLPFASSHVPTLSLPARVIDPRRLRFLFQKQLQNSDVSSLRRMVLPKKAAESHLPTLETKEGIYISMDDMDGVHIWNFKYRFWPNNNSRMYVLENTGKRDFVSAHRLQLGDFIMVYQDIINLNYVIQAKKTSQQEIYNDYTTNAVSDHYYQVHNFEINRYNQLSWNDPGKVEDDNKTCMSFVYETTSFSNDSPFDFLGGSMTNYYSGMGGHGFENFGSVDNLSLDDFY